MKLSYVISKKDLAQMAPELSREVIILRLLKSLGAPISGKRKMKVDPAYTCKSFKGPLRGDLHFEFSEKNKRRDP